MDILNINNENKIIAYNRHIATKFDAPTIIFHHGFMSDMSGHKAQSLEDYCKKHDLNFIRYDNYGSGKSSGEITDQTLSTWLEAGQNVVDQLTLGQNIIHIGSSLGGWIATLLAKQNPKNTIGLITLAASFDATENLIWNNLSEEQKTQLENEKIYYLGEDSAKLPITLDLIQDARQYLLLDKQEVKLHCPVHLIHGMQDAEVPHAISTDFIHKVQAPSAILKLISDGTHRLSRDQDLKIICNSIEEILF